MGLSFLITHEGRYRLLMHFTLVWLFHCCSNNCVLKKVVSIIWSLSVDCLKLYYYFVFLECLEIISRSHRTLTWASQNEVNFCMFELFIM